MRMHFDEAILPSLSDRRRGSIGIGVIISQDRIRCFAQYLRRNRLALSSQLLQILIELFVLTLRETQIRPFTRRARRDIEDAATKAVVGDFVFSGEGGHADLFVGADSLVVFFRGLLDELLLQFVRGDHSDGRDGWCCDGGGKLC